MVDLISIHIPKTAGISLMHALLDEYGESFVRDDDDGTSPDLTNARAIHGHFRANKYVSLYPEAKWITWVRHPVKRLFSFYHHKIYADKLDIGTFEDFIEDSNYINEQTSFLAGKNLNEYFFIGIQEFFDKDLLQLCGLTGWRLPNIVRANFNKNPNYQEAFSALLENETLIDRIMSLNSKDMELYHEALYLRAQRRNETVHSQYWWMARHYMLNSIKKHNLSKIQSGNGEVIITRVELLNSKLQKQQIFHMGERVTILVSLDLLARKEDIVVGFLIKDGYGNEVFGTNTKLLEGSTTFSPLTQAVDIKFLLNFNLDYGVYYLNIAVHSQYGVRYDWIENYQKIEIGYQDSRRAKNHFAGRVLLPTKVIIQDESIVSHASNNFSSNSFTASIGCWLRPSMTVSANSNFHIPIEIVNLGCDLWDSYSAEAPVFISYHLLNTDYEVITWDNQRTSLPEPVLPGERMKLNLNVCAPSEPGKYILEIDMVKEEIAWFKVQGTDPVFISLEVTKSQGKQSVWKLWRAISRT